MKSLDEFQRYVGELMDKDDNIAKANEKLTHRKKYNLMIGLGFGLFLPLLILAIVLGNVIENGWVLSIILAALGLFCAVIFIVGVIKKGSIYSAFAYIESAYKMKVIEYLFADMTYSYDRSKYIGLSKFCSGCHVYSGEVDRYKGEDLLKVNIPNDDKSVSNNWLVMSDLHAQKRVVTRDKDGKTEVHYETIFMGTFGYIDFPYEFQHELYINVYPRGLKKCEKLKLEDVEFNKKFNVYSDDQVEGRYILTTELMLKLKELSKLTYFTFEISENHLYLTLPGAGLFNVMTKSKRLQDGFLKFYKDYLVIFSIVKEIAGNNKIFKI